MKLSRLFPRRSADEAMDALYGKIVAQARQPGFYADLGVPDTAAGRFDLIVLHTILVLRRLRGAEEAGSFAQDLFDTLFRDMDRNLREMGVGDLSVPKRVRKMAEAFYGRAAVYDLALDAGDEPGLAVALKRNVFAGEGEDEAAGALTRYALAAEAALREVPPAEIMRGRLPWPAVPVSAQTP